MFTMYNKEQITKYNILTYASKTIYLRIFKHDFVVGTAST